MKTKNKNKIIFFFKKCPFLYISISIMCAFLTSLYSLILPCWITTCDSIFGSSDEPDDNEIMVEIDCECCNNIYNSDIEKNQ